MIMIQDMSIEQVKPQASIVRLKLINNAILYQCYKAIHLLFKKFLKDKIWMEMLFSSG